MPKRSLAPLLMLVVSFWGPALAYADSFQVQEGERIDISGNVVVFSDISLSWQALAQIPISEGHQNPGSFFNVDEYGLPLWARVDFSSGKIDANDQWLLGLNTVFGGDISLYLVADGELLQETHLSKEGKFSERPHPHRLLHFPLNIPANKNLQLLLKIESAPAAFLSPYITTEIRQTQFDVYEGTALGFAFGWLAMITLYHLVLAIATYEKIYLIYSLYVASNGLWMANYRGLAFKYLWPDSPWIEANLGSLINYLPVFLAVLFAISFLQLQKISKRLTKFYYGVCLTLALLLIIRVFIPEVNVAWLSLITMITFFSFIYAGILSLSKGVTYARYYLIAWTVYCLSMVNWMLVLSRLPAFMPESAYWVMILAYDAEVLLLALALAHRIRTMRQSKLEAEADNRAKSEFLARMSHEIRTPLSGVLGMAELLSDRLKDKTNLYYTNIIRTSGTSLLTIINDILDYSKFTSGKMELEKIPFSLQRLAVDSLDVFKVKAAEKGVELIVDLDLDLPPFVLGDPTRVKQVMLNFISNAIKFTDTGQIVLRITSVDEEPDKIRIAVVDSGVGISRENQEKLFEVFSQASASTARKHGGTGLGLSISKQLAHLMGGHIGVESRPQKGSTFWITACLPKTEFEQSNKYTKHEDFDLSGYKVLIVEDNYTFSELLQTQARAWGMNCRVAKNGEKALEILRQEYDHQVEFDLISLDLVMPIMDGLETSRFIQADERFQNIPRLLLTSATNFPSQHALTIAGIKRVIEKPTLPADLKLIYKELLSKDVSAEGTITVSPQMESVELPCLSILVAEDNSVNQMVINGILKRLKQDIKIVENGQEALEAIKNKENYDLILMDCDMPVMDGKTATAEIRAWEETNNQAPIRIVALTAHAVQSQIDECFASGMDDYLSKPIDISKLEGLLKEFSDCRKRVQNA